jgi:hypothetical protein
MVINERPANRHRGCGAAKPFHVILYRNAHEKTSVNETGIYTSALRARGGACPAVD